MPAKDSNTDTDDILREILARENYVLSKQRQNGEQGADIIATKSSETHAIEVIAYKGTGPSRRKDFFEAIFGALSRLNLSPPPTTIGIAISNRAEMGFQTRVNNIGEAWDRFGRAFPEFRFWFVDLANKTYVVKKWTDYSGK